MDTKIGKNKDNKVWIIAYINSSFLSSVEHDLKKSKSFLGVNAHIPTVRILRKQFKGRYIFQEVPLLFNYGFFEIPREKFNVEFIRELKENVMAIYDWVKDPAKLLKAQPKIKILHSENGDETFEMPLPEIAEDMPYGIASAEEVARLVELGSDISIYDKYELDNVGVGSIITLKGYPFEDVPARILVIDSKKEEVKVELLLDGLVKKAIVSFDNVFYTIYSGGHDETVIKETLFGDIEQKTHSLDKLFHKNQFNEH